MDLLEGQVVAATVPSTTGSSDHLMGAWDTWPELQCRSPSGRRGICCPPRWRPLSSSQSERIRPCWSEACAPPHTAIPATTPSRPHGSSGAWPPSPGAWVQLLPARPLPRAVPSDRRGSQEGLLTVTRPPSGADSPPDLGPPAAEAFVWEESTSGPRHPDPRPTRRALTHLPSPSRGSGDTQWGEGEGRSPPSAPPPASPARCL